MLAVRRAKRVDWWMMMRGVGVDWWMMMSGCVGVDWWMMMRGVGVWRSDGVCRCANVGGRVDVSCMSLQR